MKEDFLSFLWKFQKFNVLNFFTSAGESIQVLNPGSHNVNNSGPDFFNALLVIGSQKWAGNIEIHVKSSDWFVHQHQNDSNYDNVILHVVWEDDVEVFRKDNSVIPSVSLQQFVSSEVLKQYQYFFSDSNKMKLNCEGQLSDISNFIWSNWLDRLYFERLETKSVVIQDLLKELNNNWEAVCFCLLAKGFGGNSNGADFLEVAKSIPFKLIQKETSVFVLEALLMGQSNLLNQELEDEYYNKLKKEYQYLKHKYQLKTLLGVQMQFFKLRPPNFPTIRLAQLAMCYASNHNFFNNLIVFNATKKIHEVFRIQTSKYWEEHFTFGKTSARRVKKLTPMFIDLLLINTVIPLRFIYDKHKSKENQEIILDLITSITSEKNNIATYFKKLKIPQKSALQTQAQLQLKKEYCDKNKCLQCAIGYQLMSC